MNKIYKLVWSKTRNCWMAVAEIAKSHTKSPKSGIVSQGILAGMLVCALGVGMPFLVDAAELSVTNVVNADGHYTYIIGDATNLGTNIVDVFAVGNGNTINNGTSDTVGEGVIVIGDSVSVSLANKVNNSRNGSSEGTPRIEHVVAIGDSTVVGEENTVALGYQAQARALNAFAGGTNAQALSEGATALGHNAKVNEDSSFAIAVGYEAEATGEGANAFGDNAQANDRFAVAFGRATVADKEASTAIGNYAQALDLRGVAIGNESVARKEAGVAIGNKADAMTPYAVAIGRGTVANGASNNNVVAIGNLAHVGNATTGYGEATAVGGASSADGYYATAVGATSTASNSHATAIGYGTQATGDGSTSLGSSAVASGTKASALGSDTEATGNYSVALGNNSHAYGGNSLSFGNGAKAGNSSDSATDNNIAIGYNAISSGESGIAMGFGSSSSAINSVAIGHNTSSVGASSLALGYNANSNQINAVALGNNAIADGTSSVAIGVNSKVKSTDDSVTLANGVAIGNGATVTANHSVALGYGSQATENYTVSVGDSSTQRRIVNVANGTVNTDASTVAQTGNQLALSGTTLSLKTATGTVLNSVTLDSGSTYTAGNGLQLSGTEFSAKAGTNVTVDANGISVAGNGVIDNGNAGLISGGTLYNEVNVASDGNYIVAGNTTAQNLGALDTAVKNVDDSAVKSITANGTTVTYTKGDGTTGTFTTQDNNTEYTAGNGLELTGTEFKAKAGTNVTVDTNGINVVGNGTVANGDTGLVSGGTLFTEGRVASNGNYVQASNTVAQNLTALDTQAKANADAVSAETTAREGADTALGTRIDGTITDLSVSGQTVTYTKGDGTTGTITTQDNNTEYTAGNGLTLTGTEFSAKAGTNVSVDADGINVVGNGVVASGNTGLVSGGTAYAELRPADGNYIAQANTTAQNLTALDTQVKANADVITGLGTDKANVGLDNISDAGQTVIQDIAKASVKVVNGTNTTVTEGTDGIAKTYAVNVTTNGTVTSGNTGIVTGGTVYTAIQNEATARANADTAINNKIGQLDTDPSAYEYISATNTVSQNLEALDDIVVEHSNQIGNFANKDASNIGRNAAVDNSEQWGAALGAQDILFNDNRLVTSGTMYGELKLDSNGNYVQADSTTAENIASLDTTLKNTNDDLEELANSVIRYDDATKATVTLGTTTQKTKVTNMADATLSATSSDAVTGKQLYETNQSLADEATARENADTALGNRIGELSADGNYITTAKNVYQNMSALDTAIKDNETALDGKANVDLDNLTAIGITNLKGYAKSAVEVVGDGADVVVTPTVTADKDTYTVSVNKNGTVTENNTGIVTGGTVYNALRQTVSDVNDALDLKANKDASNVSANTAQWGAAIGTGVVAENNGELVTGGTVYTALQGVVGDVNTALDNKADIDLGNITDDGKTVIKTNAKEAIDMVDGAYTTVNTTEVNGVKTFAVDVTVDGQVVDGNTGIVNGGTVYTSIQDAKTELNTAINDAKDELNTTITDGLAVKANADASNVTDAQAWGEKIATGAVADGDVKAVSGGTVNTAINSEKTARETADTALGNRIGELTSGGYTYISATNDVSQNLEALDDQVRENANQIGNFANKDASNIGRNATIDNSEQWGAALGAQDILFNDNRLITSGTMYGELKLDSNGSYVQTDKTTAENIKSLDTTLKNTNDSVEELANSVVRYDDATKATVTLGTSTQKTKVTNVDDAELSDTSTDAVTGKQLYTTNQALAGEASAREAADTALGDRIGTMPNNGNYVNKDDSANTNILALDTQVKANVDNITNLKDLSNITTAGENVIKNLAFDTAKTAVSVEGDGFASVTKTTTAEGVDTYTVSVVADGVVADGNTKLVTGGQVYDYVQAVSGGAVTPSDLEAYAKKDASNVTDTTAWGTAVGTGTVAENNGELVTGGTVYIALQGVIGDVNTALDNKADIDLGNITDNGKTVIKTNAKEAIDMVDGAYTTVNTTEVNGVKTFSVDVTVDGQVADGNTGIVTGGTVYTSIQDAKTELNTAIDDAKDELNTTITNGLATKANADASNVTDAQAWGEKIATGAVADGDAKAVSGGTVYTAIGNAKTEVLDAVATDLTGKANVALDNLSDAGIAKGKEIAQAAVQMENGTNTTVTSRMDGDNRFYKVNVAGDGTVTDGDTGLVTGGTVYSALSDRMDKDLGNISDAGRQVINDMITAGSSNVAVAAGDNVAVAESTAGGIKTYTVSVPVNGVIENGNTGIVDGGTVYSAIEAAKTDANAYTDTVAATKSLDNLDADGIREVKTIANSSITLENGTNTTVAVRSDGNDGSVYRVDVATDGAVAENDNKIVTGGTVYTALRTQATELNNAINDAKNEINTALDGKANVALDNLSDAGTSKVRQLAQTSVKVVPGTNTGVTVSADGTYLTYAVNVAGNGIIDNEENRLVTGSTIYNEVRPAAGNYVRRANTVATNLTVLDTNLKDLSDRVDSISSGTDLNAVHYDGDDKSVVTMVGAEGTKITNLKDAELSATSTDAVTGKQLYAVEQELDTQRTRVTDLETNVGALGDTVTDLGNRVNTVETTVSDHETAINGLQGEVTALDGRVDAVETAVQQNTTDITNLVDTVNGMGDRVTAVENATADLGGRMDTAEQDIADVKQGLGDKANTDMDNITEAGKDVIRGLAKGVAQEAVQVVDGTNTVVTKNTVGGNDQYSVDVVVDGVVEEGNTGIVDGGMVYEAIKAIDVKPPHYMAVKETNHDDETYDGGATGDDSVALGVASKAQGTDSVAIGHGSVASGEQSIALGTGNQVSGSHSGAFGDLNDVSGDGSYAFGNDNTVSGNNTFVLGNNVSNATGNNTVVLGNGSDGSQDNVVSVGSAGAERKIVHVADGIVAKGSTDAINGGQLYDLTNEVERKADADASNIDVQKFADKLGTGTVTEGDNGLVKGGTVYTAIQQIRDTNIVPSADGTVLNVGPGSPAVAVDFTNSNGEGRVLQGVVTNPNDPTSAANVGYVDAIGQNIINGVNSGFDKMNSRIDKVGAGAAAMASLAPLPFDDDQKWNISAAIGTFHGEQAGAVGLFYKPADNVMLNLRGSFGNGENMGGAGVTVGLNKGAAKGLSKVAMARAMNAQADELKSQRQQIASQQQQLARQQAEIEELKKLVRESVKK